ncbi:prolipoprotein diacylglyceryl transferase [bacterium]|nr:prolipoprotein diacylglyceryl transferase [bacterium]
MHPVLFYIPDFLPFIGGRPIHTYGALVATAFLVGLWWSKTEAKRVGLSPERVLDLFFYIVLSAIIGSRLLYVVASVPQWWKDPMVFVRFWEGGLVFYGGLIGAVATSVYYTRKHDLPFFKVADVFAPGIAIGHAIGRLGCFAAGCCFGKPASPDAWYAVIFPLTDFAIAPHDHPVYPTQLFESFGELCIFLFLMWFRRKKTFDGEVFLMYLIIYPILRSVLEIYRGDTIRGFVVEGVLSTSQFISIIWFVMALILWFSILKRKKG